MSGLVLNAVDGSFFDLVESQPFQSLSNENWCNEYRIADQIDKVEKICNISVF